MVEYSISDIAEILNISKEMVRYYEKCGVIRPKRSTTNNYRVYTTMDLFQLGEAIQLTRFDINIKQTTTLKEGNFVEKLLANYIEFYKKLDQEIQYDELLKQRCLEMIERTEMSALNLNNFWVKKIPEQYAYCSFQAKGDNYKKISASKEIGQWFLSSKYGVFSDSVVEFKKNDDQWFFCIDKKYADILKPPINGERIESPLKTCLCTIIDMGEMGLFNREKIEPMIKRAEGMHYKVTGNIQGVLCGRGVIDGKFRRYMELRLPI
ncbi:MerR family transcriptional regulator [Clostridium sp. 19966]|uniref:MerR family transcriptional regulator n=1 Tax=Clostridium sp. 19966 TaxID=2768166 RepID=UPI0028DF6CA4|nr:MerR family transcriptional regulator [Clostridium sp. 19966]MDT8719607.1 MerR family transcriptional regulator [Clostridium sp. 19966]